MASLPDIGALYDQGRYKQALDSLQEESKRRLLQAGERVLLVELLARRGEWDDALRQAHSVLQDRNLSIQQRCCTHQTLGECYFRKGDNEKGSESFRRGIELAVNSGELWSECNLRVNFFRHQIHWLGPQDADASVASLRRKTYQIGDPSIALTFQFALTELFAKLAIFPAARKHLQTARALLPKVPNLAYRHDLMYLEVALAAAEGDFTEALRHGLELEQDADVSVARSNLPILLGYILINQAEFAEAEKRLQKALTAARDRGSAKIALRDTLMLLSLCQDRLEEAGKWDVSIRTLLDESNLHDSYHGLWSLVTRVRWLYRSNQASLGLRVAQEALPRIQKMADRNLLARMHALIAEGLGLTGEPNIGMSAVAAALSIMPQPPLDVLAEIFRVIGGLVAHDCRAAAFAHLDRAKTSFEILGNFAEAQIIDREKLQLFNTGTGNAAPDATDPESVAARVTEQIAAFVASGANAQLLASQAATLIDATGSGESITKVEINSEGRATIEASATATTTTRATLLCIERLANAAVALAKESQRERERTSNWQEQSNEQLGLICSSERMLELIQTIRRVATSSVTVLLEGETGVGKELFAQALHRSSHRADRVFLPFNCGTVPRELFDSQLFGHRRGSFTGAHEDAPGVIRSASGGTLFLDEIGETAIETQPKLLRFLESGEILPLGDSKPQFVDVRVVAATNAKLDQMVADGRFREDLFYRLNVIRIHIPPLRDRREEIPALVDHFLEKFGREYDKPLLRIADETLEYLVLFRWPGNVRQLANEIRRMVAFAESGSVLMPAHLSDPIVASRRTIPTGQVPRGFSEIITRIDQPLSAAVEHVERAAIQRALSMTDGHLDEAARMLGLSRKGLYLKRQRLNIG
ncbi:MAG: sigma-54 dependent transcriptional regulator [Cyanobacteria bacterium]|nr:sigma-54 dependent transcriptional regulator [Cyanobacteriota bacterium]